MKVTRNPPLLVASRLALSIRAHALGHACAGKLHISKIGKIGKVNFPEEPSHAATTERAEHDERELEMLDTCVGMRSTFL